MELITTDQIFTTVSRPALQSCKGRDIIVSRDFGDAFNMHQRTATNFPLLLNGDAITILRDLPDECIDFAMTSPPYWGKREYENGGIGLEDDYRDFVMHLAAIFAELKRVLKSNTFAKSYAAFA